MLENLTLDERIERTRIQVLVMKESDLKGELDDQDYNDLSLMEASLESLIKAKEDEKWKTESK